MQSDGSDPRNLKLDAPLKNLRTNTVDSEC